MPPDIIQSTPQEYRLEEDDPVKCSIVLSKLFIEALILRHRLPSTASVAGLLKFNPLQNLRESGVGQPLKTKPELGNPSRKEGVSWHRLLIQCLRGQGVRRSAHTLFNDLSSINETILYVIVFRFTLEYEVYAAAGVCDYQYVLFLDLRCIYSLFHQIPVCLDVSVKQRQRLDVWLSWSDIYALLAKEVTMQNNNSHWQTGKGNSTHVIVNVTWSQVGKLSPTYSSFSP